MTMPHTQSVVLPAPNPNCPVLTRMITHALLPEGGQEGPVTWVITRSHPLEPTLRVVRMFIDRGGVDVYSVAEGGVQGIRNLIPMSQIRLIEEAMPLNIFVDELAIAEEGGGDDDDDDDADDGVEGDTAPAPASGGVAP